MRGARASRPPLPLDNMRPPNLLQKAFRTRADAHGDTAILTVFFLSITIIVGALSFLSVVTGALSRTRDITDTSQALYAADTAIERGLADYRWSTTPTCTTVPASNAGRLPGTSAVYTLVVKADGDNPCPTAADIQSGRRALCVGARGSSRGGAIQRRVTSDIDLGGGPNRCGS